MRPIQILAPVVGLIATAKAGGLSTVWTTVVETDYTTYCPSATTFAWKNVTYTATTETTLTITNCPCTVTYSQPPPVTTTSYATTPTYVPTGTIGTSYSSYSNASSTVITFTPPPSTYISGTTPITVSATNTPIPPTTSGPIVIPTAGAEKLAAPAGALLVVGLAAFAL
ncbi:uncharacterized protein GGS25DRAFT_491033 [Hypoxylon fragiforme]|uniref:uncharacterized protein n=1 Tax=Hypoxylon fragiforme TaxID=63214 RepID=UPI0020C66837|nr:uncharacterized protein GGS25DRAFT_491033 [Hypoxylon fragiforme]KAI2608624.1 hypothetical protein GGS25DRAFT_491033 [Hypoxylon fragiforme]